MIKIQWDLVEASFIGVSATTLFKIHHTLLVSPINNKFKASSSFFALWTERPNLSQILPFKKIYSP